MVNRKPEATKEAWYRYKIHGQWIFDVRNPMKVGYHETGWCGEDGWASDWSGPSEDNI